VTRKLPGLFDDLYAGIGAAAGSHRRQFNLPPEYSAVQFNHSVRRIGVLWAG
jgi:hypothetical protein